MRGKIFLKLVAARRLKFLARKKFSWESSRLIQLKFLARKNFFETRGGSSAENFRRGKIFLKLVAARRLKFSARENFS